MFCVLVFVVLSRINPPVRGLAECLYEHERSTEVSYKKVVKKRVSLAQSCRQCMKQESVSSPIGQQAGFVKEN